MEKYKTIIIDDMPENVDQIKRLTQKDERFEVVATANNGANGLKEIAAHNPELVLLDVEMPVMGGIDMVMALKEFPALDPIIVFVTMYDKYAIQAIRNSAFDYILKTNLEEFLPQALHKFAMEKASRKLLLGQQIEALANNLESNKQIVISTPTSDYFIRPAEIVYIVRCENASSNIIMQNGRNISTGQSLILLEGLLPKNDFYRLDRKHLINIKQIDEIIKENFIAGRRFIKMKGLPTNKKLLIPLRKYKLLMDFVDANKMLAKKYLL